MFSNRRFLTYFILAIIFAVALFLRFYKLGEFPVGFHIDEASLGYNGYSLLLTGKDENNHRNPLYVDTFGDNRPSGYHYLTVLPIKLLGLNEFATRLPGALFGSISIFAIYFLTMSIFGNKKISLLSSFLVAIAPWHIVLSRASAESVVALFFISLGMGLILYSLQNSKISFVALGTFLASVSFFFYHTPRVFVPLLFLAMGAFLFSIWKKNTHSYKLLSIISFVVMFSLVILLVFKVNGGTGRYSQVNIFSSFETNFFQKQQIQEDAIGGSNYIMSRFFHNKITNVSLVFISNYFDYFGFNFLFTKGGLPIWYSIPRVGILYLLEFPFILMGIYYLIRGKNIYHKIPLVWLLLSPIVPAITMDDVPNINRAVVMFPMLEIIAASGFLAFIKSIKYKKQAVILATLFLLLNNFYFLHQYFVNAKVRNTWYRNNGFSAMMKIVRENYQKYDAIVMSKYQGGIYPLVLFYMHYDPAKYQSEGSPKNKDYGGFGKFFFMPQDCPSIQRSKNIPKVNHTMYVDKGDCVSQGHVIYREDGTKAFRIVYE